MGDFVQGFLLDKLGTWGISGLAMEVWKVEMWEDRIFISREKFDSENNYIKSQEKFYTVRKLLEKLKKIRMKMKPTL